MPYQLGYATKESFCTASRSWTKRLCRLMCGDGYASPVVLARNRGYAPRSAFGPNWMRRRESNSHHLVYKTSALKPIELRRNFGGPGGTQTLTRSLQDFYAVITSPAR